MYLIYRTFLVLSLFLISIIDSNTEEFEQKEYGSINFYLDKNISDLQLNSLMTNFNLDFENTINFMVGLEFYDNSYNENMEEIISYEFYLSYNSYASTYYGLTSEYNEEEITLDISSGSYIYQIGFSPMYSLSLTNSDSKGIYFIIGPTFNFLFDIRTEHIKILSGEFEEYKIYDVNNYTDEFYKFLVTLRSGFDFAVTSDAGYGLRFMYEFSYLNYYQNQSPLHSISVGLILLTDGK